MVKSNRNARMDLISRLPNELSSQILSYINVFELAKFERVSKSWQSIIRTNATLWKDDGFDGQAHTICSSQHQQKYRAMLERSGGKLDKVFLPLCSVCIVQDRTKSLVSHLPKSDVKDLWIVVKRYSMCPKHREDNEANVSNEQYCDAFRDILKAVVHCVQLKNLRLISSKSIFVNMINLGDPAKWPFSANRLKKLALHRIRYDSLFPCQEVYQTISEAEDIEISFPSCFTQHAHKDILPFLSIAKATLKRCYACYVLESSNKVATMPKTYMFPQLERMFLAIFKQEAMRESGETQVVRHNLECPNLKALYAPVPLPSQMMERLLCENIEDLCISNLPMNLGDEMQIRMRILEKLEKCTKLRKLILYRTNNAADIKNICVRLSRAPLEEIVLAFPDNRNLREVKQMVKDRISDGSSAKILKVTIVTYSSEPEEEIAWFQKHVPKVVLYSSNDQVHLNEFKLGYGLYPFERE